MAVISCPRNPLKSRRLALSIVAGLLVLIGFVTTTVTANQRGNGWFYGVGLVASTTFYRGDDDELMVLPIIGYRDDHWQIFGPFVSYRAAQFDRLKLELKLLPEFGGYSAGDSEFFSGMSERKDTVVFGPALTWQPGPIRFSLDVQADILGRSNGLTASAGIGVPLRVGGMLLTPGWAASYKDRDWTDYHVGVRPIEQTADRPSYQPGSAINHELSARLLIPRSSGSWNLQLKQEWLDSAITDSPLVKKKRTSSLSVFYSRPW